MRSKNQPQNQTNTINPNAITKPVGGFSTIDCTGPDGRHFQTTQKECDSFNAAWAHPPSGTNPSSGGSAPSGSSTTPPKEDMAAMCGRTAGYHWTGSTCTPN